MNILKTPFGFSETQFGKLNIYSAKLRFREIQYIPDNTFLHVEYRSHKGKSYCIISYETTNYKIHIHYRQILGKLAKTIAQSKLNNKYGWVNT